MPSFFFSSRRRHTRCYRDWSSDVCSSDLISAIRRVRREVPEAAGIALAAHDYDAGTKPVIAWDDPVAKEHLVSALVNDALTLIHATEGAELTAEQHDAVGLLALVAGQDVEPGDTEGTWRIAAGVAPDRVISTVDPEGRHMHKSRSAYGSGEVRAALKEAKHRVVIKPIPLRPAVPGGFTIDDFTIDVDARTATCPRGFTVPIARTGGAKFGSRCQGCPLRERCTRSRGGRVVTVHAHHDLMVGARLHAQTEAFQRTYRRHRPMVERSIAWLVADGHRRVRYRGVLRNQLGLSLRVAAINLRRLITLGLDHQGGWVLAT